MPFDWNSKTKTTTKTPAQEISQGPVPVHSAHRYLLASCLSGCARDWLLRWLNKAGRVLAFLGSALLATVCWTPKPICIYHLRQAVEGTFPATSCCSQLHCPFTCPHPSPILLIQGTQLTRSFQMVSSGCQGPLCLPVWQSEHRKGLVSLKDSLSHEYPISP